MTIPSAAVKLTCMFTCYNEELRIAHVLAHALEWADEVLVINKSSNDKTVEICKQHGPRVKIVMFPYTEQGDDDIEKYMDHAVNEWVFVTTCSEVPTRRLIESAYEILRTQADILDLIFVPRKIYSFGEHHPTSPWSISYYPFLVQRQRALLSRQIHANFSASAANRVSTIPYADDCCVHHFTHASAVSYLNTVSKYVKIEIEQTDNQNLEAKIISSFMQIYRHIPGIVRCERQWPMILAAWCVYHFGLILHAMERLNGGPVQKKYHDLRASMIAAEWGVTAAAGSAAGLAGGQPQVAATSADFRRGRAHAFALKAACFSAIIFLCVLRPSLIWGFLKSKIRTTAQAWRRAKGSISA